LYKQVLLYIYIPCGGELSATIFGGGRLDAEADLDANERDGGGSLCEGDLGLLLDGVAVRELLRGEGELRDKL